MLILALTRALGVACGSSTKSSTKQSETTKAPNFSFSPGPNGPDNWSRLSPKYKACNSGTAQSPIELTGAVPTNQRVAISYTASGGKVKLHGNGFDSAKGAEFEVDHAGGITIDGTKYELEQLHFHGPSEHRLDGKSFPMEIHLVHESSDHKFAAVGLFVEIGASNPALAPVVAAIPAPGEQPKATGADVDLSKLAPTDPKAYRYNGSLTTPPCTEGITWIVFPTPLMLGADQVQALLATAVQPSNRPLQPLNGRRIDQVAAQP